MIYKEKPMLYTPDCLVLCFLMGACFSFLLKVVYLVGMYLESVFF